MIVFIVCVCGKELKFVRENVNIMQCIFKYVYVF